MPSAVSSGSGFVEVSTTLQTAVAASGNGTAATLASGTESLMLKVTGADTPSLTLQFEVSFDSGSTWEAAFPRDLLNTAFAALTTLVVSAAGPLRYHFEVPPGCTSFRARCSARVTGNATVTCIERRRL